MIRFNKKYLSKYFSSLSVLLAFLVFVYQLHAQEVVVPPESIPEPVHENPSTVTTEEVEPEAPSDDDQGILGGLVDFVEENIFNSGDPEEVENPSVVEVVPAEPAIPEEIIEEPVLTVDGELKPAPFFENKNALLVRGEVDVPKESIDYTNGSHTCSVSPFSVDISHTFATTKVSIQNINQIGQELKMLEIGELPRGFNVTFANQEFSQKITSTNTEFIISLEKNANSQKGSFTVPVLYSVGETTVLCQVNIINR